MLDCTGILIKYQQYQYKIMKNIAHIDILSTFLTISRHTEHRYVGQYLYYPSTALTQLPLSIPLISV